MSIAGKDSCAGLSDMTKLDSVSDKVSENPWTNIQLLIDEDSMLSVTVDVLF